MFLFLSLFLHQPDLFSEQEPALRIHFLNVGYGDSVLMELPDQTAVLIDAGDESRGAAVLDYLKKLKVQRISTAVITHPHKNHFGGFAPLLNKFPVNWLFINGDMSGDVGYGDLLEKFKNRKVPVDIIRDGDWITGLGRDVEFKVLHPHSLKGSTNGNSLVMLFRYKETAVLFTSDIEEEEQNQLIKRHPEIAAVDAVTVPHHGGNLSENFIRAFQDKLFILSTGPNEFGLPREEDLKKLKGEILRTDRDGTIVIEIDEQGLRPVSPRNEDVPTKSR